MHVRYVHAQTHSRVRAHARARTGVHRARVARTFLTILFSSPEICNSESVQKNKMEPNGPQWVHLVLVSEPNEEPNECENM